MGNYVGNSNADLNRQSSFTTRPQQVVQRSRSRNGRQFLTTASHEHLNVENYPRNLLPNSSYPLNNARNLPRARLDVQQTCVVKNIVNLRKNSVRVIQENGLFHLSFIVDASVAFRLKIYYLVYEEYDSEANCQLFKSDFAPEFPSRDFAPSLNTRIVTNPNESIDPLKFTLKLLMGKTEGRILNSTEGPVNSGDTGDEPTDTNRDREDDKERTLKVENQERELQPIVIELRPIPSDSAPLPSKAIKCQCTYAKLIKISDHYKPNTIDETGGGKSSDTEPLHVETELAARRASGDESKKNEDVGSSEYQIAITKQKIQFENKLFEVQEIFGIERSALSQQSKPSGTSAEDMSDLLSGIECVICLAEERNTAVLPCRHMCLCSGCANIMRMQSNKCPICRQTVTSLLQITASRNVENGEQTSIKN